MTVKIVTDSSCDLPRDVVDEYKISVVPLFINIGNKSYQDGVDISHEQFYQQLPHLTAFPKTSAPGSDVFSRYYDNAFQEGVTGIISIHIAHRLSNTFEVAQIAAREYKQVPVCVFDSGQLTIGVGLLVIEAAKLAARGGSVDQILAMLERKKKVTYSMAALETIDYLKRSGRLSTLQYGIASLLNIKPIMKMHDGIMELERIRTSNHSFERVVNLARSLSPFEELALIHTNAREKALKLYEHLKDIIPSSKKVMIEEVTPVIGAHVGPGGYGFSLIRQEPT
jgi:DegV family protein with EDD domain